MKESLNAKFKKDFQYDHRELMKFKDGGQTYLDFKGTCFKNGCASSEDKDRPILCICPGLTSSSAAIYVLNFVDEAHQRGFDAVVINHRGLADCELSTPQMYACNGTSDLKESIEYVHEKFNGIGRKLMVIGVSLGANRMTCLLGELGETDLVQAACILSAPMKLWIATEAAITTADGFYDKALGQNMEFLYRKHEP